MEHASDCGQNLLVAWAAGTVAAQVKCTLSQATELIEARVRETHASLDELVLDIIDRRVRFE